MVSLKRFPKDSLVTSSRVGPNPPEVITASDRFNISFKVDSIITGLSLTVVILFKETPSLNKKADSQLPFLSEILPERSSSPMSKSSNSIYSPLRQITTRV